MLVNIESSPILKQNLSCLEDFIKNPSERCTLLQSMSSLTTKWTILSILLIRLGWQLIHMSQIDNWVLDPLFKGDVAFLIPQRNSGRTRHIFLSYLYFINHAWRKAFSDSKALFPGLPQLQSQLASSLEWPHYKIKMAYETWFQKSSSWTRSFILLPTSAWTMKENRDFWKNIWYSPTMTWRQMFTKTFSSSGYQQSNPFLMEPSHMIGSLPNTVVFSSTRARKI